MIRPVPGGVGQGFGENPTRHNPHPVFGNYQPDGHAGQDYPVPTGTRIKAVTSGVVVHVGYYKGAYSDNPFWIAPSFAGFCYVVNHDPAPGFPRGFFGIYAHGQDKGAWVSEGARVEEGQTLGMSGNTGGSTGPHLHFEILPDGYALNGFAYGRVNPERLYTATITAQGALSTDTIITALEGAGMALDLADKVFIQELVNGAADRTILDARDQIKFYAGQLAEKIANSEYQIKVFAQASDNFTGDRVINDNRAQAGK